jgi:hypothetical protein
LLTLINPVEGPKYSNIGKWDDGGTRSYNAMLLSAQKRLSKSYSMTANYTMSHCIGTAIGSGTLLQSSAGNGVYLTPTRTGDRGNCTAPGADVRHIVNGTGIINVPKFSNPWMNTVASNWRVSGILTVRSGSAFTIVSGSDRALNGKNAQTQYANQVSDTVYGSQCTDDLTVASGFKCLWLNPAAFAAPDLGSFGNLRPGTVFGPGYWTLNAGLSRIFRINEKQTMEFRADGTNMLNHTNFNAPNGTITNGQFGRIQSAQDARVLQFGLKYLF